MLAKSEWKDESLSYEPITDIISTPNAKQTWVHLTLDNGNTITTTDGHPFNTPEGWRDAILLKKGGQLLLKGEEGEAKTITITNITVETKHQTTYNLEVANAHTFFVGEDGVLVHNGKGCKIVEVVVDSTKYPESARHIKEAQATGHPKVMTINRAGANANRRESLKNVATEKGKDRDEYPPAMFEEGGYGASVKKIDSSDNRGAGSSIGQQCRGLACGTQVKIVVK